MAGQEPIEPPFPLAMIICDAAHRDPATGKYSLLGCFSSVTARNFPATHTSMSVYIAVSGIRGPTSVRLRVIDVEEESDPIYIAEGMMDASDPKLVVETDLTIKGAQFPAAGEYRFQLFAGQVPLLERRIYVHKEK